MRYNQDGFIMLMRILGQPHQSQKQKKRNLLSKLGVA